MDSLTIPAPYKLKIQEAEMWLMSIGFALHWTHMESRNKATNIAPKVVWKVSSIIFGQDLAAKKKR